MQVVNIHALTLDADRAQAGPLLDALGSRDDLLWPVRQWPAMRLDGPLGIGARGGHGPIGYTVTEYVPGQRVRFDFDRPAGFDGYHEFLVEGDAGQGVRLVHELRMQTRGTAVVTWRILTSACSGVRLGASHRQDGMKRFASGARVAQDGRR